MSGATEPLPPITIAEFDAFLSNQEDDAVWELVRGRVIMQPDQYENHARIVSNISARLKLAMDKRGCRTYPGGIYVQRSDDVRGFDKPRPDVLVRCGEPSNRHYVTDPVVVVEVLSPSTMDADRYPKLEFYKSLPTMCHIVLVYQDSIRVEHYCRTETGWGEPEILLTPGHTLALEAVGFEIGLETVYFGVML